MADYLIDQSSGQQTIRIGQEADELASINRLMDEVYCALVDHHDRDLTVRCRSNGKEAVLVQVRVVFGPAGEELCDT